MDNQILIRVDKGLKKELELMSAITGLSISEFIRRSVLKEMSKIYLEQDKKKGIK